MTGDSVTYYKIIIKSSDGGSTWSLITKYFNNPLELITSYWFLNKDTGFVYTHLNNIYYTTNGGKDFIKWKSFPSQNRFHTFYEYNYSEFNNGLFVRDSIGNFYKTTDFGNSWINIGIDTTSIAAFTLFDIHFVSDHTGFALGSDLKLYKTNNKGKSWKSITNNYLPFKNKYVSGFFVLDSNTMIYSTLHAGPFKSIDNGQSFFLINNGLPDISQAENKLLKIFFYDLQYGWAIVLTNNGYSYYRTKNGGLTWGSINRNFSCPGTDITGVDSNTLMLWNNDKGCLYKTNNGGGNFVSVKHNYYFRNRNFAIYPNPVHNQLTLLFKYSEVDSIFLEIFNLQGQKVFSHQMQSTETTLNVDALPKGIYFVRIMGENGVWVGKFIKE